MRRYVESTGGYWYVCDRTVGNICSVEVIRNSSLVLCAQRGALLSEVGRQAGNKINGFEIKKSSDAALRQSYTVVTD